METEGTLPVHTMGILFTIMCLPTLRHNIPPREVIGALAEGGAIRVVSFSPFHSFKWDSGSLTNFKGSRR